MNKVYDCSELSSEDDFKKLEVGDVVLNAEMYDTHVSIEGVTAFETEVVHSVRIIGTRHPELEIGDMCLWTEDGLYKLISDSSEQELEERKLFRTLRKLDERI